MDGSTTMALTSCIHHEPTIKERQSVALKAVNPEAGACAWPGQMTVEFVIAFPAALIIALISVNALLFFSECAAFDRAFRSLVCIYAVSPAYEQGTEQSCARITEALKEDFSKEYVNFDVTSSGVEGGIVSFNATLMFTPTLFGKGTLTGVFGVAFPPLVHQETIVVDVYKPGVFF